MTSEEDKTFVVEEVINIVKDIIERLIGNNSYQHDRITRLTAEIVDQTLTELTKLQKSLKYIVQAVGRFLFFFVKE